MFLDINSNINSIEYALDQYIAINNAIELTSSLLKIDINQSVELAVDLKNLCTSSEEKIFSSNYCKMKREKVNQLKKMLTKIDWLYIDKYLKNKKEEEVDILKHVFQVAYQLQAEIDNISLPNDYENKQKGKLCEFRSLLFNISWFRLTKAL